MRHQSIAGSRVFQELPDWHEFSIDSMQRNREFLLPLEQATSFNREIRLFIEHESSINAAVRHSYGKLNKPCDFRSSKYQIRSRALWTHLIRDFQVNSFLGRSHGRDQSDLKPGITCSPFHVRSKGTECRCNSWRHPSHIDIFRSDYATNTHRKADRKKIRSIFYNTIIMISNQNIFQTIERRSLIEKQ